MRGSSVNRCVDELFDLLLEHAFAPRDGREVEVSLKKVGIQREQALPEWVPVSARLDEVLTKLALLVGQLGWLHVVSPPLLVGGFRRRLLELVTFSLAQLALQHL